MIFINFQLLIVEEPSNEPKENAPANLVALKTQTSSLRDQVKLFELFELLKLFSSSNFFKFAFFVKLIELFSDSDFYHFRNFSNSKFFQVRSTVFFKFSDEFYM
jgi:hypothetical protein